MQRLDYLCDLVLQLDRKGYENAGDTVVRLFKLLKARRQPAKTGAHILHLAGPKGFRLKPNVATQSESAKVLKWLEPDERNLINLSDAWDELNIQDRSQTLIYGRGSSGKAALGMYILHRRPLPTNRADLDQRTGDLFSSRDLESRRAIRDKMAGTSYEARTLVVSFLYPATYYRNAARRLRTFSKRIVRGHVQINLPDRALVDVISLYPGDLSPEDFLAKVELQLNSAELRGLPYTGVLIDGIHNVFVQYPALQSNSAFWPQLYNVLRRRGVSVVTTHTEFDLKDGEGGGKSLSVDFELAQRKAAPLLSVLVSGADYVFELSTDRVGAASGEYRLIPRGALGDGPPAGYAIWNRQTNRVSDFQLSLEDEL